MEYARMRTLFAFEVVDLLREEGIVCGDVIMNSQRFVKRCHLLGFHPERVVEALKPF